MGTRLGPGTAQFVVKVQISLKGGDAMLVYNKVTNVILCIIKIFKKTFLLKHPVE